MKTLVAVAVSVVGVLSLLYALRNYMPGAMLILGALAVVAAMIARSVNADPKRGWPTLAFFTAVGFVLTAFFTVVGAVEATRLGWLVPLASILFLALAIFSVVKWTRLGTASYTSGSGARFDSVAQAADQSRAADIERRRAETRKNLLAAQNELLAADQKIRDLQAENTALRSRIATLESDLDAAVNDPLFDQASHPLYKHV